MVYDTIAGNGKPGQAEMVGPVALVSLHGPDGMAITTGERRWDCRHWE